MVRCENERSPLGCGGRRDRATRTGVFARTTILVITILKNGYIYIIYIQNCSRSRGIQYLSFARATLLPPNLNSDDAAAVFGT